MASQKWNDDMKRLYQQLLNDTLKEPLKWDTYDDLTLQGLDWRLWHSVESLDLAFWRVKDLMVKAEKRRKREYLPTLQEVSSLIDNALSLLDSAYWKTEHRFMGVTTEPQKLRDALTYLERSLGLYSGIYLEVSVNIEARRRGDWTVITHLPIEHLRDATYAIKQFLTETGFSQYPSNS